MEQSNLEKQNGALKGILLLLFIFGVSAMTILGYHYYPVLFKSTEPWERKADPRASKVEKKQEKTEAAQPTTTKILSSNEDSLKIEGDRFAGAWAFTGGKGIAYHRTYSSPQLENGKYIGNVTDENNVNFAKYTVSAGNELTLEVLITNALNTAGEKNTYNYKFSNNGKTFTLLRKGTVLSTWERK